jgi:hypothetical protein
MEAAPMSLVALLATDNVRDKFKQQFEKPKLDRELVTLAEPRSARYTLVGTAFDYLLRFRVKLLNPAAIEQTWIAERPLLHGSSLIVKNPIYDEVTDKVEYEHTPLSRKVGGIIEVARRQYRKYMESGIATDELLRSTLKLAQLDAIYRARFVDPDLGNVYEEDIEDLKKLLFIADDKYFRATKVAVLNPTFGKASVMIGGADADLLIDDTLIEIKVTKKLEFPLATFHQIMGYILLNEIGGIDGIKQRVKIRYGATYFARQGYIFKFDVKNTVKESEFENIVAWFAKCMEIRPSK